MVRVMGDHLRILSTTHWLQHLGSILHCTEVEWAAYMCSHIATKCVMITRPWTWAMVQILRGAGGSRDRPYPTLFFFFLYGERRAIIFMYSLLPRTNLCNTHDYSCLTVEKAEALKDCSNVQSPSEGIES